MIHLSFFLFLFLFFFFCCGQAAVRAAGGRHAYDGGDAAAPLDGAPGQDADRQPRRQPFPVSPRRCHPKGSSQGLYLVLPSRLPGSIVFDVTKSSSFRKDHRLVCLFLVYSLGLLHLSWRLHHRSFSLVSPCNPRAFFRSSTLSKQRTSCRCSLVRSSLFVPQYVGLTCAFRSMQLARPSGAVDGRPEDADRVQHLFDQRPPQTRLPRAAGAARRPHPAARLCPPGPARPALLFHLPNVGPYPFWFCFFLFATLRGLG